MSNYVDEIYMKNICHKTVKNGEICMREWYTRQEVADLLEVSKATVYHYAKQRKIIKIEDPHRLFREARYEKREVDLLAEERRRNEPTGMRPSALAKELNVPVQRIYTLIHETDLPIEQLPSGDERMIYSIPDETADWMRDKIEMTASPRGMRVEFFDARYDIALYQQFKSANGQKMRVIRNEAGDWGFQLPSGTWIPYADGRDIFGYAPIYSIHQPNELVRGYTDFTLPKNDEDAFLLLDFIYEAWGIENIRIREEETSIKLSIKSGERNVTIQSPIPVEMIQSFIEQGAIIIEGTQYTLVSGYRRTTFDLPSQLLEKLSTIAQKKHMTMSEYVEAALTEKIENETAGEES